MRQVTLCYCLRDNHVLLGMKKRGFGVGKLNGYGGKVHGEESIEKAVLRELNEEAGISAEISDLQKVAEIDFFFPKVPKEKDWNQTVHVYVLGEWEGTPVETEEMRPEWHPLEKLPMEKMWVDDPYWLNHALNGKKIRASFHFENEGESVLKYEMKFVEKF